MVDRRPGLVDGLLPVLGPVQRAGGQIAAAAKGAAAAIVVGAAGVLPMVNGTAAASPPPSGATVAPVASVSPGANRSGDDVRSGGVRPTVGAGDHLDVPKGAGGGSDGDPSGEGTGGGGSDAGGRGPGGGTVVDDPAGTVNDVVNGVTDTVDGVVDGATDTVDGVVDGATDVVDGVLGPTYRVSWTSPSRASRASSVACSGADAESRAHRWVRLQRSKSDVLGAV